jgi:hypothetical protein
VQRVDCTSQLFCFVAHRSRSLPTLPQCPRQDRGCQLLRGFFSPTAEKGRLQVGKPRSKKRERAGAETHRSVDVRYGSTVRSCVYGEASDAGGQLQSSICR